MITVSGSFCDIKVLESKAVNSPVYGKAFDELRLLTPKPQNKL